MAGVSQVRNSSSDDLKRSAASAINLFSCTRVHSFKFFKLEYIVDYNVALVSGIQQSDSDKYIYTYIYTCTYIHVCVCIYTHIYSFSDSVPLRFFFHLFLLVGG